MRWRAERHAETGTEGAVEAAGWTEPPASYRAEIPDNHQMPLVPPGSRNQAAPGLDPGPCH